MAESGLSGLGASIRRAVDSETFDLAGKNASTIESAIRDAFGHGPFPLTETIRLTFVTGAGKLARQKYDDNAAKAITSALRDYSYQEDQSGGAGTFKLQHDTGKNLKTVVVHPLVTGSANGGGDNSNIAGVMGGMSLNQNINSAKSLIPDGTPEHKIAYASTNVFQRMIASTCPSWSQKKGCLAKIDEIKSMIKELDDKLLTGTPLNDAEQALYDSVSMTALDEKQTHVRELMQAQVDAGEITSDERKLLLAQVQEKISALTKDLDDAKSSGKPPKRIETLTLALTKGQARLEKISKISPKPLHKLKNEAQIVKLRTEMIPLAEIEASTGQRGQLRSIKDTQAIARKEEIEEEIEALENASRGWFESDEDFAARVQASRAAWRPPAKKKTTAGAGGGAAKSSSWATTTSSAARRKPAASSSSKPAASSKPKGGGVFAAMMMDSDSD